MLIVTLGDPYSANIELLLRVGVSTASQWPVVLIGSEWQWRDQIRRLGLPLPAYRRVSSPAAARVGELSFLDVGSEADQLPAEHLSPEKRGALSVRSLSAVPKDVHGQRLAVVTGPIDKHACHMAGFEHPGQTEFFESLWESQAVMTLAGPRLRVGLVTNHLALADVPGALSRPLIETKLSLFIQTLQQAFSIKTPRIAVAGLNPHAGDHGLFGRQEIDLIAPVVATVEKSHANAKVLGPLPADTVFYRAYHGQYDGVLAMYHDQGLGPLKTVHFDDAINLSGGLKHLRVSPDHGPAADLFLQKKASILSMEAAIQAAAKYLSHREPSA